MIKKEEALQKIISCAKIYDANLNNQNYMFVFKSAKQEDEFQSLETLFLDTNFLHLTGVRLNEESLSSKFFYRKCITQKLKLEDFYIPPDGAVELKLDIMPIFMQIHKNAKMIGEYSNNRYNLSTDIVAGSIKGCLGFVSDKKNEGYYVPNTLLKCDIREIIKPTSQQIIAIYSKKKSDALYSKLRYLAKGITSDSLTSHALISQKFSCDILEDFNPVSI